MCSVRILSCFPALVCRWHLHHSTLVVACSLNRVSHCWIVVWVCHLCRLIVRHMPQGRCQAAHMTGFDLMCPGQGKLNCRL